MGLPGGLMMLWMCPLLDSTKRRSPPSNSAERYTASHGVMWSLLPATVKLSRSTCLRSIGVPHTSSAFGRINGLFLNISIRSPWNAAGRRVVSLFQNRMSNTGGSLPNR
ncbi:hypothetical protein D9M73_219760 [compost metagenome]